MTAFNVSTQDNEVLYAWHVLPLNVYEEHESELSQEPSGSPDGDFTKTKAFELLANDPDARLILNCACHKSPALPHSPISQPPPDLIQN